MGVWITCRSPAPSEIVLCKTKQMCPGLAPSEGTAPAAARSPAPGLNPRQHLKERGRAVLQLTRALRELRARGAARLHRAPRCHQAGAAAPALHQLCAASGEATSKQSWPRLAPGAGAGAGTLGAAPRLLPWGNFSLGTGRPPRSSASPQRAEGSPGSLLSLRLSRDTLLCSRRFRHASHLPAQLTPPQQPSSLPPNAGLATQSTPDLLCQHSRPGFHNPRGRQSTAALLPGAQPHARPGLRARAGDGPGCRVHGP